MANKKKTLTPKMMKRAEELASRGLNKSQVAQMLGMGKTTLYTMLQKDEELSEYIRRGELEAIKDITAALYDTAISGNVSAQIFFLKNRAGWSDKQEVEHSGVIDFKNNTLEGIKKKLKDG